MKRVLLILLATALGLLLAEGLLQILHRGATSPFEYDSVLGWNVKLHFRERQFSAEGSAMVSTNGQHMRESRDFATETDAYRIAVVGDSMVWGHSVEEEERFTELLETMLGPGFEVMNFGVAGFGSGQLLLRIQKDVLPFRPDMLVVAFFLNDLIELRNAHSQGIPKPRFVVRGGTLKLTGVPVEWNDGWVQPRRRLKLVELSGSVVERVRSAWETRGLGAGLFRAHLEPFQRHKKKWLDETLRINDLVYTEIWKLSREEGMELAVIELPFKEYFLPDEVFRTALGVGREALRFDRVRQRLPRLSERLGFLYVDPHPAFERAGAIDNFYPEGPHFNPRGHATVAQALYEALAASGALPLGEEDRPVASKREPRTR